MIEGYYIERFINICKSKKIAVWNLKREKDIKLRFKISIQDFKKICEIAKKTKCKVKIESKKGMPFFINKHKKRKVFLFLLIALIVLVMLSSNYVWNVEIQVENNEILENIEQDIVVSRT